MPKSSDKVKVLHVYRYFHPDFTGDGIYYMKMIPLMRRLGTEHDVLVTDTRAPIADAGSPVPAETGIGKVVYLNRRGTPPSQWQIRRAIARMAAGYDILHIHSHVDRAFAGYLLARARGCHVVFSCTLEDSPAQIVQSYSARFRALARQLLHSVDRFVAISPRLFYGGLAVVPAERMVLIPQGVAAPQEKDADRDELRRRHGVAAEAFVLLYIGGITRRKQVAFLVERMGELAPAHEELHLYIVGPALEADYLAAIERRIHELGLAGKVVLAGAYDDPSDWYRIADCFVFASASEGFGNVLIEAMAHGLPVVARKLPGVTDYFIADGETGFLFEHSAGFDERLERLIADPALRREIGDKARRLVSRHFDLAQIAARYVALYRELAGAATGETMPAARVAPAAPTPCEDCAAMRRGPAAFGLVPVPTEAVTAPILQIVVDTEAEFDWTRPVSRDDVDVSAIAELPRFQDRIEAFGVHPVYVVDYPVASTPHSAAVLRQLAQRGAEIGAHLQPWTTPPVEELLEPHTTFAGNLPADLETRKLRRLTEAIAEQIGLRARVYKAGRYGLGPASLRILEQEGFEVDLSLAPAFDFSAEGGPDFTGYGASPYWFGQHRRLLALPVTAGYVGLLREDGVRLQRWQRRQIGRHSLEGVFDRAGMLARVRLSPEGYTFDEMVRLTDTLLAQGVRVFTLSFHSPSLRPGCTPYVRDQHELERFYSRIERYLDFFLGRCNGRSLTATGIKRLLEQQEAASG